MLEHPRAWSVMRRDGSLGAKRSAEPELIALGYPSPSPTSWLSMRRWAEFTSNQPLRDLIDWQDALSLRNDCPDLLGTVKRVGGLDVSYGASLAVAGLAIVNFASDECLFQKTLSSRPAFPYIPGYLSFRELPPLVEAVREATAMGHRADVWLVDGNGRLHPRGAGIATALGHVLGQPTIGVAKSLLCGRLDQPDAKGCVRILDREDSPIGMMMTKPGRKPLYVSVGYGLTLSRAVDIVHSVWRQHRLPEPTRIADGISRARARLPADD
jgi:deoxyribonuclease V